MVRNKFPKVFILLNGFERNSKCFCLLQRGLERNSAHIHLPWNDSEQNYTSLSVFLFYEMVLNRIPSIFTFCEMVRNKVRKFLVFSLLQIGSERNSEFFYLP
jgi:hypothetical protein